VREAVGGYRRPTLATEVAGARDALTGAGIDVDARIRADGLQPGSPLVANLDGFPWRAQLPALAPRIISQIDGRKTVAEIYTAMGAQGGLPRWEDFYAQFEDLYIKLNGVNHVLLRFRP